MKNFKKPYNHNNSFTHSYSSSSSIVNNSIFSNKGSSNFNFFKVCCFSLLFILTSLVISLGIVEEKPERNTIHLAWAEEINGTNNADNMSGTINKDTIKGLDGNDTIYGKEAGDDVSGGSGDDLIYGNEGRDILKGKAGNDRIEGGEGKDKLFGDRGNDVLVGGQDDDTLTGGLGMDTFICGNGTDLLTDFNITQKDNTPENDCENLKNGDVKTKSITLPQQKNSTSVAAVNKESNQITNNKNNSVNTTDQNKKVDDFFFGLFK
jgi:Ca2+-binding RTX toxin-like protein